jgi:hypothetical protein
MKDLSAEALEKISFRSGFNKKPSVAIASEGETSFIKQELVEFSGFIRRSPQQSIFLEKGFNKKALLR